MKINENVKIFAKISGKSALKWTVVMLTGLFMTLLFLVVTLICIDAPENSNFFGHTLQHNFFAFLMVAGSPLFLIAYYLCANKMAVAVSIYETWKQKGEEHIRPAAAALIEKATARFKADKISSPALVRLKMIDAVRNSSESRIKKRIIGYVFKRIRLDDVDFTAENVTLSDVLAQKFTNFITEAAQPSWLFFLILSGLHVLCFILALVLG